MQVRRILPALLLIASTTLARAQTLVRTINGPAAGAQFGKPCLRVPDQNGDGFRDVLVGAPGFNSQRGAIHCISGAFLATGAGPSTLWSVTPSVNPADRFGAAIAEIGDLNADGFDDFLVGQPGYDDGANADVGAVRLIDGLQHTVLSLRYGTIVGGAFGSAIVSNGDVDGDGKDEVVVGAPGTPSAQCTAFSFPQGVYFLSSGAANLPGVTTFTGATGSEQGSALASGFDLDGDGFQEFAIGTPGADGPAGTDCGRITIATRTPSGAPVLRIFNGPIAGERMGASIDARDDYDGDGVVDLVVGAPNSPDSSGLKAGRVLVLSGAKLLAGTQPYEIRTLTLGFSSTFFDFRFGTTVCASRDLSGDGVGEILVGTPDYATLGGGGQISHKGLVTIFSGATGARWASIAGGSTERFGDAIAGALDDLDGDGFEEFVAGGSLADANGTDSGVLKCYRLFPLAPSTYCTGKLNSLGCTPAIDSLGIPTTNPALPFLVMGSNFLNQKNGLLFYSLAPTAVAFQGGFKCAANPTLRTPSQNSGGSPSGNDCSGTHTFDFNAWISSGVDPALVEGVEVFAQWWARDPASPSHTSLSNALRFLVQP